LKEPSTKGLKRRADSISSSTQKLRLLRKFPINSAITREQQYYFVPRTTLSQQILDHLFRKAEISFVLIVAPRASGKTSLLLDLPCHTDNPFEIIYISFENILPSFNIWTFLHTGFHINLKNLVTEKPWQTAADFETFVSDLDHKRQFVLVLDEMDVLLEHPSLDIFLATLRKIRTQAAQLIKTGGILAIKSIVGVGMFALLLMNVTKVNISPFNIKDAIILPFFSLEESQQLYKSYQEASGIKLAGDIVLLLQEYTNGYPGLICLCGNQIQAQVQQLKCTEFTKSDWDNLVASGTMVRAINAYATTSKILQVFKKKDKLTIDAAEKFIQINLSGNETFPLDINSDITQLLANHGLVTALPNANGLMPGLFKVTCPMMCSHFGIYLARLLRPPFPLLPLPLHPLNITSLLCNVLAHMSTKRLHAGYTYAVKKSEIMGVTSQETVLKEAIYSQEFASILNAWFPDTVSISPEANCESNEADLFIKYDSFSLTLEFCANERYGPENRRSSFLGHVKRGRNYADSLNSSVCVMHFIGVENFPPLKKPKNPPPPTSKNETFAYIFHKHDMTDGIQLTIWSYKSKEQQHNIKFKDQEIYEEKVKDEEYQPKKVKE
jgi:hypothetical protein